MVTTAESRGNTRRRDLLCVLRRLRRPRWALPKTGDAGVAATKTCSVILCNLIVSKILQKDALPLPTARIGARFARTVERIVGWVGSARAGAGDRLSGDGTNV